MGTGKSKSTNTSNLTSRNIAESMSKTIQNCQGNTLVSQKVVITGNFNVVKNVRMVQGLKISASCALDDKSIAEAQQSVSSAIKQAAESSGSLLGGFGDNESNNSTTIDNEVRATITKETMQNIINNFTATQEFYLNGNSNIVEDISYEQTMEALLDNCLSALSQMSTFQAVTQQVDSEAKSVNKNFVSEIIDSVGGIFSSGYAMIAVIVIAFIIGGVVLAKSGLLPLPFGGSTKNGKKKKKKKEKEGED